MFRAAPAKSATGVVEVVLCDTARRKSRRATQICPPVVLQFRPSVGQNSRISEASLGSMCEQARAWSVLVRISAARVRPSLCHRRLDCIALDSRTLRLTTTTGR